MAKTDDSNHPDRIRIDWRGWLALAWVLWWGWAYALMVIHARSPLVLSWLRQFRNWSRNSSTWF